MNIKRNIVACMTTATAMWIGVNVLTDVEVELFGWSLKSLFNKLLCMIIGLVILPFALIVFGVPILQLFIEDVRIVKKRVL